ncbi:MAG: MFS transporter [Hyphomicrobiales bacterium]|nr:MAG: MFS transporter [Hyphomicrobiales bacterium]
MTVSRPGSTSSTIASDLIDAESVPLKRVAFASFVGSAIEYYDFYIYGLAAALVFPHVFFPSMSPTLATIASFATFGVAFLSRPAGAAFFGHFGDRLGRKKTLIATLLIMGLSTVAVGLVPSAASIGLWAPLILLFLRLLQGFAVGGEWAGAALLTAEYAPAGKRGKYGMFPQIGVGAGLVLSSAAFVLVSVTVGAESEVFLNWAWRLPFLFSAVLVVVALYVRLNIAETPVFQAAERAAHTTETPLRELLRKQFRQVALGAGAISGIFTFVFMGGTYLTGYGHSKMGHPYWLVLTSCVIGGACMIAAIIFSAPLCDRLGRRAVIAAGFIVAVPWSFAVMPLIGTGSTVLFVLAIAGTFVVLGISYGPMASFFPELFATRFRYTGAGLAYNMGGIVGGAVPPLLSGVLLANFGAWAIGVMLAMYSLVSLLCTTALSETKGSEL